MEIVIESPTVLSAIYEMDFLGFSYGFRPGRSQHDALDALVVGISSREVNWILGAPSNGRSYRDSLEGPINSGTVHAACRFTRLSAIAVNFWSAAFSSASVSCRTCAQSFRPSCLAYAIREP